MSKHTCTIYHQNDFGYTARCACYCQVQLVFGNGKHSAFEVEGSLQN